MILKELYKQRNDGVKLYRYRDVKVTDQGDLVIDANGHFVSSGFYILQNETGLRYSEAVDVEYASYTYSETTDLIPKLGGQNT